MDILNQITNTKPVADSFVNDQLKWRRERIEELTKQRTKYFQLYQKECRYVKHLAELINIMIAELEKDMCEIPNARELQEKIQKHIDNQI